MYGNSSQTDTPNRPPPTASPSINGGTSGSSSARMTAVRGPPLSSQKYKSFHYSRVASVAEEDYDASTAPSSYAGSFNCNVEGEDNTSLETMMLKSSGRQDASTPNTFRMIDENSTIGGHSEPILNPATSSSISTDRFSVGPRRIHRFVLSPPSLHMSFDVDNSPWPRHQQALTPEKPLSKSSDNVANRLHPCSANPDDMQHLLVSSNPGHSVSPPNSRHSGPGLKHQSLEIAQISAGFMKTSGAIGQFRNVLSAPFEKSSLMRTNFAKKRSSKERQRQISNESGSASKKNSFSTTTLHALYHTSLHKEVPEAGTCPTSIDDDHPASTRNVSMDTDHQVSPRIPAEKSSINNNECDDNDSKQSDEEIALAKRNRLKYHRELFNKRRQACDWAFGFAIMGIVLMIIETELTANNVYTKDSPYSYVLKSILVLSTVLLVAFVSIYHMRDIKLFMLDYGCDDWRVAVRKRRMCLIALELLICSICPVPGNFSLMHSIRAMQIPHSAFMDDDVLNVVKTVDGLKSTANIHVPVDIILSIPMFLRLYLICRLMLLHSKLFTDAPSRSISTLNRVNITSRLVLKMMMTVSPVKVLLAFTGSFWLTAAWIMLVCERYGISTYQSSQGYSDYDVKKHQSLIDESARYQSYLNSIWLVAVTALTVGFGDVVPNTYCGRTVSIICGIVGAGTSSLVVAVVARKLEFSRAEKHVHNFMMDSEITKRMKHAAANVLRETWLIYKHRHLVDKVNASKIRYHQRKFLLAIYELRKTKRSKRKLDENLITIGDMAKTTRDMYEILNRMQTRQIEMEQKICDTDKRCANVEAYIGQLQISICALPELVARKIRPPSPLR